MLLGSYRRIIKTDYPAEFQDFVDQLGTSVNKAFNDLYTLSNNNITFADNIAATIATFNVTVDKNGIPQQAIQVKLTSNLTKAQGTIVINCTGLNSTSLLPSGGIFVTFANNSGSINITNIQGLQAGNAYTLTILCI